MVREALSEIWKANGWPGRRVQNRDVFSAIVAQFGWRVLRSEYLKALRDLKKQGVLDLSGTDDNDYTTFH